MAAIVPLPPGFRDVLTTEARTRRRIEDAFARAFDRAGFNEIAPSGVEYLDVYARSGQHAREVTFKFLDRDDNLLAMRADFTPAIARIVASGALGTEVPHKLWYSGPVFRKADLNRGRYHELRQIGAELIGANSIERDVEMLQLALTALEEAGIHDAQLHLNHAGVFRGIINNLGLNGDELQKVKEQIDRKDMRHLASRLESRGVDSSLRQQLDGICRCVGDQETVKRTRGIVRNEESRAALDSLLKLSERLEPWKGRIVFDLTEIDEMEYYTGVMFTIFSPRLSSELGKGGRYDALLREYGQELPAIGFSCSLDRLAALK
jgi:ATP phosphoribosyltransferase regulatory subunit